MSEKAEWQKATAHLEYLGRTYYFCVEIAGRSLPTSHNTTSKA